MDQLKKRLAERRIEMLRDLVGGAPDIDVCDRHDFGRYLALAFDDVNLSDRKIAEDMGYVVTSVRRWKSGHSCPHRALWPQIVSWIKDEVEQKIAELDDPQTEAQDRVAGDDGAVIAFPQAVPLTQSNTSPATMSPGALAASGCDDVVDLTENGSLVVELDDGSRKVKIRLRRYNDKLMVRREGKEGDSLAIQTSTESKTLVSLPKNDWVVVYPESWRFDSKAIGHMFRWPLLPTT